MKRFALVHQPFKYLSCLVNSPMSASAAAVTARAFQKLASIPIFVAKYVELKGWKTHLAHLPCIQQTHSQVLAVHLIPHIPFYQSVPFPRRLRILRIRDITQRSDHSIAIAGRRDALPCCLQIAEPQIQQSLSEPRARLRGGSQCSEMVRGAVEVVHLDESARDAHAEVCEPGFPQLFLGVQGGGGAGSGGDGGLLEEGFAGGDLGAGVAGEIVVAHDGFARVVEAHALQADGQDAEVPGDEVGVGDVVAVDGGVEVFEGFDFLGGEGGAVAEG